MRAIAIVGGGVAAATAVRTLRRRGFDGRVTLIGDEAEPPYQRPPLSKEYLGDGDDGGLCVLPEKWCAEHDVELRLGVPAQRLAGGGVEMADGAHVPADGVLLATGGRPRHLAGAGGPIHYLRTRADADRLRSQLVPGAHVVVIGGGFIGSEVAATARSRGADVTVIEALDVPLRRPLGAEMGAAIAELHRVHGVALRYGEAVQSVVEHQSGVRVTTSAGAVDGTVVVAGLGIVPNVEVAERSGIPCENGILVDEQCRTAWPNVFAAGDVANQQHPLYGTRVRVEHFDNATKQAAAAANGMLGRGRPYAEPHWFWSDQYDVNLQYAGHATAWDELVVRGSVEEFDFCAFYLRGGRMVAAFGMDRGGEVAVARELIAGRVAVDPAALRDESVHLADLVALEEV